MRILLCCGVVALVSLRAAAAPAAVACSDSDAQAALYDEIFSPGRAVAADFTTGTIVAEQRDQCASDSSILEATCDGGAGYPSSYPIPCPTGQLCVETAAGAACTTLWCSDGDGTSGPGELDGNVVSEYTAATAHVVSLSVDWAQTTRDGCHGDAVVERYCSGYGGIAQSVEIPCPDGLTCAAGACVPVELARRRGAAGALSCVDRDPLHRELGAYNVYVATAADLVVAFANGVELVLAFDDHCLDLHTAVDYYCRPDGSVGAMTWDCDGYCLAGACVD